MSDCAAVDRAVEYDGGPLVQKRRQRLNQKIRPLHVSIEDIVPQTFVNGFKRGELGHPRVDEYGVEHYTPLL
jgi:hypothetical protein